VALRRVLGLHDARDALDVLAALVLARAPELLLLLEHQQSGMRRCRQPTRRLRPADGAGLGGPGSAAVAEAPDRAVAALAAARVADARAGPHLSVVPDNWSGSLEFRKFAAISGGRRRGGGPAGAR